MCLLHNCDIIVSYKTIQAKRHKGKIFLIL